MKKFNFTTSPEVCSTSIDVEIGDSGKITFVRFNGGCHGSLQAVSALVKGKTPEEAAGIIRGILCGNKNTSCPDQLAIALESLIPEKK
ncbi:MAG: TIGR03905 family TSCPD domain-containing protein [Lentisphaerae bacterium]|nr:TIGR03905 family TSCPD domain-containing protein [Lentisphaerota bacterium]